MSYRLLISTLLLASVASAQSEPAPRETLIVLNKSEASISLIDPATFETRATVGVGEGPHEAAVSPGGRTAVVCNYGARVPGYTLSVIDVEKAEATKTIELGEEVGGFRDVSVRRLNRPHGIVFFPDGKRVAVTVERSRKLAIVDIEKGAVEATIPTKQEVSHMVAVTADNKRAFVANIGSGSVSVLDLEKRELIKTIETGRGAEGIAVHPTRRECWVTNRAADTISVIDTEKLEVVAEIECGTFPIRIAFTPDGAHALVSNARSGAVAVLDVEARKIVREISMDAKPVEGEERDKRLFADFEGSPVPVGILMRPDGKVAYVANTQADIVTLIDTRTWKIAGRIKAGREPDGMAWSSIR